jgi:hypothetical protein
VEVWVDGDGRTRRYRYNDWTRDAYVWELYDFGVSVDLTPPPSDQVK